MMTTDIDIGQWDDLPATLEFIEVEHKGVTIQVPNVTDRAHIDPSLRPTKISVSVGVPSLVRDCASPLEVSVTVSDEIGLKPWESIDAFLELCPLNGNESDVE